MINPGILAFKLQFQINPIFLTGGLAGSVPGGMLPVTAYTQGVSFSSLTVGGEDINLDNAFASFVPVAGSTLISNQIGTYPFANQATAANAVITTPLAISLVMLCPARNPGDYSAKMAVISALKATLDQHIMAGGTFAVATPAFLYTDCLLVGLRDTSGGESNQPQFRWQWDFQKPLISLQEAQQKQNNLMSKLGPFGTKVTPDASGQITWSNPQVAVGNPGSGVAPSVIPSTTANPALGYGEVGPDQGQ